MIRPGQRPTAQAHVPPAAPLGSVRIAVIVAVVGALLACQALIGGTRLLFAFPAYALLALGAALGVFAVRQSKPLPDGFCLASAALFFGYVLLRASSSPVAYLARFDIYSVIAGLLVYFLTATVLANSKARLVILVCLLVAALGHVVVGAIQFRNGNNWMPIAWLQRFDYGRRASGFYICPNHLAGLLEVLGAFGLSIAFWSRWPVWSKLLVGYVTMVCYVGLILTGSRGGYLSVLTSLLVFAFLSLRIVQAAGSALQVRIGLGALLLALVAALVVFLVIEKSDYLTDRTKSVVDNKNVRLDLWRAGWSQWKESPWIGTGSRTYLFYGRKFRTDTMQLDPVYTHNDYLELLAEYGLLGGVLFVPFLIIHLRRGWITARRVGPRRIAVSHRLRSNAMALNLGALAAVAAYVVHSFFDFNLHIPANVLLLAFVFGILANSGVEESAEALSGKWRTLGAQAAMLALALFLGWRTWRLAPGEWYAERARTAVRDYHPLAGISSALKGISYEKQNPQLFYQLGRARTLAADGQPTGIARDSFYRAALGAYEAARVLAPADETYWVELGFTFDALRRFPEAEWMFNEAFRLDPKSAAVHRYYQAHLHHWRGESAPTSSPQSSP